MGYIDKTTQTVTAHFTKRGRELLADALSGDTTGKYIITQFALGDDEIDYSLYEEGLQSNSRGRVIENMPLLESFINEEEIMNYYMTDAPDIANTTVPLINSRKALFLKLVNISTVGSVIIYIL